MKIKKCTILIISVGICIILLIKVLYSYDYIMRTAKDIPYIERTMDVKDNLIRDYLENRLNRVAQTQDEYQYSTSRKIQILEERIKRLEKQEGNNNFSKQFP